MKDSLSLNSLNKNNNNNINNNKKEEFILEINNNENENNLLLEEDYKARKPLTKKNEEYFSYKEKISKKVEERIICYSRRRKMPKNIEDLTGFLVTFFFFIFFSILMTICLSAIKELYDIEDSLKSLYSYLIFFIWITSIICIICLLDAASADPGRQRGTSISQNKYNGSRIRKIMGGKKYALKYCTTCHLIRDIRTFHCNTCGLCIEKHDHHCNYLSNCVGVYNYKKFFIFINFACIHVSIIFFTCCHFFFYFSNRENFDYKWIICIIIIIFIFAVFFEIFTVSMVVQHIIIIIQNRTTREYIKNKEYRIYSKGCRENCKEALCNTSIKEL